jgi:hypothetical protein
MTDPVVTLRAAILVWFAVLASPLLAEVKPVTVEVKDEQVWVGEKATFVVTLRGRGPFDGATAFSLPQIPRTVVLKVGSPVVSSEEIEDESWFVQSHEFALFTQNDGVVKVPDFEVRFGNRDGVTGPVQDQVEQVPAFQLRVKRPEGSDPARFLITTETLTVQEQWDPTPGEANQGDVFHRTITQRADQVSGMALAPPPLTVPDGVRLHIDDPEIEDNTERGEFSGSRIDRITYVCEASGTLTLPAVKYMWWNPASEQFGSTTLPAATFEVKAIPERVRDTKISSNRSRWMLWLAILFGLGAATYWQRDNISHVVRNLWNWLHPPERRAARELLRACRHSDPDAAESAWTQWQISYASGPPLYPELRAAVTDLHRHVYGPTKGSPWDGKHLAATFKKSRSASQQPRSSDSDLPPLNPA